MKIGIVSCYSHHNYGSMLQAYATQMAIERLGYDAVTFAHMAPINYMTQSKIKCYLHKLSNKDIVSSKMRQYMAGHEMKKYPDIVDNKRKRDSLFDDFYKKHIHLSDLNKSREALTRFASTCDAVVVGSDMLWHPRNVEYDFATLTFVPDDIKKISYATSFGTTYIPKHLIKNYQIFLSRFNSLSVRETSGVDVIKKLGITQDVSVVLDPTLLFTGEEWASIQDEPPIINKKYILCYFLGVNKEHRNFANNLKSITGCPIVALQHLDEFVKEDLKFGDMKPYNVGPAEFLNLVQNAEYICTDSFHGTCFSILNHKKFFTLNRFSDLNSQSTNTRIDSLLSSLGLEDRRVGSSLDNQWRKKIDYEEVDIILEKMRRESYEYLNDAVNKRIQKV